MPKNRTWFLLCDACEELTSNTVIYYTNTALFPKMRMCKFSDNFILYVRYAATLSANRTFLSLRWMQELQVITCIIGYFFIT